MSFRIQASLGAVTIEETFVIDLIDCIDRDE